MGVGEGARHLLTYIYVRIYYVPTFYESTCTLRIKVGELG